MLRSLRLSVKIVISKILSEFTERSGIDTAEPVKAFSILTAHKIY